MKQRFLVLFSFLLCLPHLYAQNPLQFLGMSYHHARAYKLNSGYEAPSLSNGVEVSNHSAKQISYILTNPESFQIDQPVQCPLFDKIIFYDVNNKEVIAISLGLDCGKIVISSASIRSVAQGLNESASDALYEITSDIFAKLKPQIPKKYKVATHIVQAGDTWQSIATSYNTSVELLATMNGKMSYEKLRPEMKLKYYKGFSYYLYPSSKPPLTSTASPSTSGAYLTHAVQPKETMYGISKKYGVTIPEIQATNGLKDNALKIGQVLKIPKK